MQIRTVVTAGLLACASVFGAGAGDYFPLQLGNQWIYKASGLLGSTDPLVVTVSQSSTFGGKDYFQYSGLDGDEWLRIDNQGVMYLYNPDTKTERVIVTADGTTTPATPNCNQTGRIVSTDASYTGPIGTWNSGVIQIKYDPGTCADAGILEEFYLPYVGLLRRSVQTIAGPRSYDLVYARLGGVLVTTAPETSFTLALDQTTYAAGSTALARFALRHTGGTPLTLTFNSGQEFDVIVRDSSGNQVYRWSIDKLFAQVVHSVTINGEKNWVVSIPLNRLPGGRYTAEAHLVNTDPASYLAIVAFTIAGS